MRKTRIVVMLLVLTATAILFGQSYRPGPPERSRTVDQVRIEDLERRLGQLDESHIIDRVVRLETLMEQNKAISSGTLGGTMLLILEMVYRLTGGKRRSGRD